VGGLPRSSKGAAAVAINNGQAFEKGRTHTLFLRDMKRKKQEGRTKGRGREERRNALIRVEQKERT